jgi:hypothetical protein
LISEIKSDGYNVESYVIPYIIDERKAGTTSLQKLLGIADIETDTEIPMLYTSLFDNPGIIQVYGRTDMPLALGSTGGGVNIEGIELAAISWEKLERDLLVASGITDKIIIFCLETSVKRGFLEEIKKLDFSQPAPDITHEVSKQERISKYAGVILVFLDHPLLLTIVLITLISLIVFGFIRLITFLAGLF